MNGSTYLYVLISGICVADVVHTYEGETRFGLDYIKYFHGDDMTPHSLEYQFYRTISNKDYEVKETEPWNWCLVDSSAIGEVSNIISICKAAPHQEKLGTLAKMWKYHAETITGINLNCTGENSVRSHYLVRDGSHFGCLCYRYKVNFTAASNTSSPPKAYCEAPAIDGSDTCRQPESTLTVNMFQNTTGLKILNITHLQVGSIDSGAFQNMKSLEFFMMSHTALHEIPPNLLCNTTDLKVLILRYNHIDIFPHQLLKCSHHKTPATFLQRLETLFLNENIQEVPARAFDRANNLLVLSLENNNISKVHATAFVGLRNLRYFSLAKNPLGQLPVGVFRDLINVQILHLGFTKLTYMNMSDLEDLSRLSLLSLHMTRLLHVDGTFCGPFLHALYLSLNNLTHITDEWFSGCQQSPVSTIHINNNNISTIASGALASLGASGFTDCRSYVEFLDLSHNRLANITALKVGLGTRASLGKLSLAHNDIIYLPYHALPQISCLSVLVISYNRINIIEDGAFDNLETLKELYLDGNQLPKILDLNNFASLKYLEILSMNENDIENIVIKGDYPDLTHLYMARNQIKQLKSGLLTRLTRLHELDISDNVLDEIEDQAIPATIFTLRLAGNKLHRLDLHQHGSEGPHHPYDKRLFMLNTLDLSNNHFKNIPSDMFDSVQQIAHINLAGNKLTEMSSVVFGQLYSLRSLNLSHNYLALSEGMDFLPEMLYRLQLLDLSWNLITDFYAVFSNPDVKQIEEVHMSGNNLRVIDPYNNNYHDVFKTSIFPRGRHAGAYPNIKKVYLNNCNISYIDVDTFASMNSLHYVDLTQNQLIDLNEFNMFYVAMSNWYHGNREDGAGSNVHTTFDIRFNPIQCSCQMRWLKTLPPHSATSYEITNCTSMLTGGIVPFSDMPLDDFLCIHQCDMPNCTCHTEDSHGAKFAHRLHCDNTGLTRIPDNLPTSLKRLYLSNNNIPLVNLSGYSLSELKVLELSHSKVKIITLNGFDEMVEMESLILSYNKIEQIDLRMFYNMTKLKILLLDHNEIKEIKTFKDASANTFFRQLKRLRIDYNNLNYIHHSLIESWWSLPYLEARVGHNPYVCAGGKCNAQELQLWLSKRAQNILDSDNVTCLGDNDTLVKMTEVDPKVFNCPNNEVNIHVADGIPISTFIGAAVGSFLFIVAVILLVLLRDRIAVDMYERHGVKPFRRKKEQQEAKYDAVLICNEEEQAMKEWVRGPDFGENEHCRNGNHNCGHLLHMLEKWNYSVFYEERDGIAGVSKADYIIDNISRSRRSIVILSDTFYIDGEEETHWPIFSFQQAYDRKQKRDAYHDVIFIEFHDQYELSGMEKRLLTFVKKERKLNINRSRFYQPDFWSRLHYLMPVKSVEVDEQMAPLIANRNVNDQHLHM